MTIVMPSDSSDSAIALASKIQIKTIKSEHGVAAVVIAPEISQHILVAAVSEGRLLAGSVYRGLSGIECFTLDGDAMSNLEQTRRVGGLSDLGMKHATIGLVDDGREEMLWDFMESTVGGDPKRMREARAVYWTALPLWRETVRAVIADLSEFELAAVRTTSHLVYFSWPVFVAAADSTPDGETVRAYLMRNTAVGGFFLRNSDVLAMVKTGASDKAVARKACSLDFMFVKGASAQAMRMAKIDKHDFTWPHEYLSYITKLGLPLDWTPSNSISANSAAFAVWAAWSAGLINAGQIKVLDVTPFAGCGGDWEGFERRTYEAAEVKFGATKTIAKRAACAKQMARSVVYDIIIPVARAFDRGDVVDSLLQLQDVDYENAKVADFGMWLLFKGSSLPAVMTRLNSFAKSEKGRTKVMADHANGMVTTEVWPAKRLDVGTIDGVKISVVAVTRIGTIAERHHVECTPFSSGLSGNGQWTRLPLPTTPDGRRWGKDNVIIRMPASVDDGFITAIFLAEDESETEIDVGSVAKAIMQKLSADGRLPGDVVIETVGAGDVFKAASPGNIDLMGRWNLTPNKWMADEAFAAWKTSLPRRFHKASAEEFISVVADDLLTYLAKSEVASVIAEATIRLNKRQKVLSLMADGVSSAVAADMAA